MGDMVEKAVVGLPQLDGAADTGWVFRCCGQLKSDGHVLRGILDNDDHARRLGGIGGHGQRQRKNEQQRQGQQTGSLHGNFPFSFSIAQRGRGVKWGGMVGCVFGDSGVS